VVFSCWKFLENSAFFLRTQINTIYKKSIALKNKIINTQKQKRHEKINQNTHNIRHSGDYRIFNRFLRKKRKRRQFKITNKLSCNSFKFRWFIWNCYDSMGRRSRCRKLYLGACMHRKGSYASQYYSF
jgi:hypothetical protein